MFTLNRAIQEIMFEIPLEVLNLTFLRGMDRYSLGHLSVEDQILSLVIRPRVLVDCNLIGGIDMTIPILQAHREDIDSIQSIIRVPKKLTNGRSITVAKNITFVDPFNASIAGATQTCGRSALLTGAEAVLNSAADIPYMGTFRLALIGENTILVRGNSIMPPNSYLVCTVSHDENLNDINPRSIPQITQACVLATKAYIYNTLRVQLDQGYLEGGQELGEIRNIISEYADANELYKEYRSTVLAKVLFFNDEVKLERYMKLVMGSGYR